ncbi:MAG: 3D domain-containing protein [Pelosinus sp.]|nr:3D domain-containing protein [Pelosinus sp.]
MSKSKFILYVTIFSFILFPGINTVHAESINEQLLKTALQSDSRIAPALQSIASLKENLSQGIDKARLQELAQTLLEQNGQKDVSSIIQAGQIGQQLDTALKTKLQQALSAELAKYQISEPLETALTNMLGGVLPQNSLLTEEPKNYKKVLTMTATAYAPGFQDNGHWNNLTYMGGTIHHGVVAVDPSVISMGSKLWIEGYGEALAVDQGSAIKGSRIDLAFDNRQDALDYGIKNLKVYVLN